MKSHNNYHHCGSSTWPPTYQSSQRVCLLTISGERAHLMPALAPAEPTQSFRHRTQAKASFRVPSPNYSCQSDPAPARRRRAASPSPQDPGTAWPRGAARGSAPWGPPRQAQSRGTPEEGTRTPPHRVSTPRPHRARKQGQGYCRAECGHTSAPVFAPVTPIKAGPRRAAGVREPQLLPEARR